jgi:hypothetical protein
MNRTSWILSGVVLGFVVGFPALAAADARDEAPERVSKRVVLLLDASGSMEDGRWARLLDAAVALIVALPADCELAVLRFSSTPSVSVALTRLTAPARRRVLDSIQQLTAPGGTTDILAAVGAAFDVLGAEGGHVIVFSDGVQTDQLGHAMPESAWLEPASRLTADARRHQTFVHSVGLGPEAAADLLLQKLADHTGGGFHAVRCAQDLVSEFVGLASEIGRFWRRSDAGEFSVARVMEVIQVVTAGSGPQLFSVSDGRRIPVDPEFCVERDQVRAARFVLAPGLYAFQPTGGGTELLRPMEIDWRVPGNLQLPAGRRTELAIGVSTPDDPGTAEMRVAVGLQYDESQSDEHTAVLSPTAGTIRVPVAWPEVLGSFVGQVTVEQGGWRCVAGRIWGRLVPPDPLQVTVRPTGEVGADGIELLTRATDGAGRLDLAIDALTQGRDVTLHVRSPHPRLRITPADVSLRHGAQRVALRLDLPGDRTAGDVVSTELVLTVSADDLVEPQINGQPELQLALRWTYAPPSFLDQLWQWSITYRWPLLGVFAALLFAASVTLRRSVVQVRISPGGVCRSLGWLHLGRKLGRPQLNLRVSGRVLHRGRRDRSADTVCLDRPDGSSCELAPGYREPVFRGDSIEVITEDGARWEIDILSGVERSVPDLDSFEPDGRSGQLPDAFSQPVAGRFSP